MRQRQTTDPKELARRLRSTKGHLARLVAGTSAALDALDAFGPTLPAAQGSALAKIANELNWCRDVAEHFGLGKPLRKARKP